MKCPHCNYEHSKWDCRTEAPIEGDYGDFFKLSNNIIMKREAYMDEGERDIIGCPRCLKLFMN